MTGPKVIILINRLKNSFQSSGVRIEGVLVPGEIWNHFQEQLGSSEAKRKDPGLLAGWKALTLKRGKPDDSKAAHPYSDPKFWFESEVLDFYDSWQRLRLSDLAPERRYRFHLTIDGASDVEYELLPAREPGLKS